MLQNIEKLFAAALYASRWLMAPLYLGLVAALVDIIIVFCRGLIQALGDISGPGAGIILTILKLIDLVLLGNLILILIDAGVDSIVSKSVAEGRVTRPEWMGKTDFAALKLKIVASIIAITAIDLLETFFKVASLDKTDVFWEIMIFLSFVVAGLLLAWMDRLTAKTP